MSPRSEIENAAAPPVPPPEWFKGRRRSELADEAPSAEVESVDAAEVESFPAPLTTATEPDLGTSIAELESAPIVEDSEVVAAEKAAEALAVNRVAARLGARLRSSAPIVRQRRPWRVELRERIERDWPGFVISGTLHFVLLLIMGLFVWQAHTRDDITAILVRPVEIESSELDLSGAKLDAGGAGEEVVPAADAAVSAIESIEPADTMEDFSKQLAQAGWNAAANGQNTSMPSPTQGQAQGKGQGTGLGMGGGAGGFAVPSKGKVVRKGSFMAWTVPADPLPRQRYLIIVQVKWPERDEQGRRFRRPKQDLTGTVVGTDDYLQVIEKTGYYVPKANQLVIVVPGAARNVEDVIRIHSKSLNETQVLQIQF